MNYPGWYPIFLKEMLLFRRKFLKLGYIFSAMVTPIIYLIAFGLGLGKTVRIQGTDYLTFLIPGLVAMSSMINSFNWIALSLNINRVYFKTFQVFVQSPISPSSILIGEILAAMVKGLFGSLLIILVGFILTSHFFITPYFVLALFLNCFLFANLGVIVGLRVNTHEGTAKYSNFIITPMGFFGGTFFSVDFVPTFLKPLMYIMPLTYTNILIRKSELDIEGVISLGVLLLCSIVFFLYGSLLIKRYSE